MKIIFLFIIIIFTSIACSDKKKEAVLENRIAELETQLEECENGADKLLARIKLAFEEENFESVKSIYIDFKNRYPETTEFAEAKTIYDKVIQIEEEKRQEAKQLAEIEKEEKLKALKKLRQENDDISGITWYYNPYFTHYSNTNLTSIYMGDNGSDIWLRLMMSYQGNDWIFFEQAYLSYDGNTKEIIFDEYNDKETDNGGGGVWEWIQVPITSEIEMFLREFAKSKDAKMRLSGKYTKTRSLTYNERQGILDVLNGYDALKAE